MSEPLLKIGPAVPREEAHGTRWLWIEDAAELLRKDVGHVRRLCAEKWLGQCLARYAKTPSGKPKWQICELAHPALAADATPTEDAGPKVALSPEQAAKFSRLNRTLQGWEEALKAGFALGMTEKEITPRYLAQLAREGITCSRGTLYRLRAKRDAAKGSAGLIDRRWAVAEQADSPTDDRFAQTVKRVYLTQNRHSIRTATVTACEDAGLEYSEALYKAAQRIIAAIPRETVIYYREGKSAFTDKIETAVDVDYTTIDSNQIWNADHHRLDVWVDAIDQRTGEVIQVRPWLTAWQDLRSRKIVGWAINAHAPNANVIVDTLVEAIRTNYAPKKVLLDNGKDFDSRIVTGLTKKQRRSRDRDKPTLTDDERAAVGGVLSMLDIPVRHAMPFHGQSKPIERWFGRVADQFSKLFDTYCGRDVDTRPEWTEARKKAGRCPTLEELREEFAVYVRDRTNAFAHLGDGMHGQTPDQVWAANLSCRTAVPGELLDFVRLTRVRVTVRQKAVVVMPGSSIRYGMGERELINRIGQEVVVAYDPRELTTAYLCDASNGRPVCRLKLRSKLSPDATEQDVRGVMKHKARLRQRAREYAETRPQLSMDVAQLTRLAAAKRAIREKAAQVRTGTDPDTLASHAPINLVRTPVELASIPAATLPPSMDLSAIVAQQASKEEDDIDAFAVIEAALNRGGRHE